MAAEVYLVRHGETEWNAQGRYQGKLDSRLTDRGREQARDVGRRLLALLKGRSDIALHTSPLGRTRETAEIIRNFVDAAPILEPRIQEVSIGSWDGLTRTDIDAGWPGRLNGCNAYDWFFRAPDGESYEEALARVCSWLRELTSVTIAVSHGLAGRIIRGAYLGLGREQTLLLPVHQEIIWHLVDCRVDAIVRPADTRPPIPTRQPSKPIF
jgi:broad specificity phosphatase PhoE